MNFLDHIQKQPKEVHTLISTLLMRKMQGCDIVSIPELTEAEQDWLQDNGIKTKYNYKIYEWEITL